MVLFMDVGPACNANHIRVN